MAITVRQLLDQQQVQLRLRAGAAGLDREVRWAHASDLAEPWQYLARNEALLTNGTGMTDDPDAQVRFVARLERAGASALGYGLETGPPLSTEAVREAERVGLPLFTLTREARFSALAQLVAEANASHERREQHQVARLYEVLQGALAGQAGTEEVLGELGAEMGARMFLLDTTDGSPVSGSPPTVFARDVAALGASAAGLAPALVRLSPTEGSHGRSAVMVPLDDELPVALLVEAADHDLPGRTLLQHLATAVTIELAQPRAAWREPQRSSILADLLAGRVDDHTALDRLAHHGLDPARCVLLAARRTGPRGAGPATYLPIGGWSGLRHVAAPGPGRCRVLVDRGGDSRLEGLAVSGWVVGVSAVLADVGRFAAADAEARWCAATAELLGREVVTAGDASTWPLPACRADAEQATRATVGPLHDHDAERGTDYVTTIRVWLELDRSWQRAADALAIHKQTLGYRLRRIEQLSGRGLTATEDLTSWWLGVRADQLLRLAQSWESDRHR
ncbi:MAG TPA: PucR family transcriptional regulator [Nocardioides sp.]|uniref:PucR family transcriptional regulator n=1 Tax=Nocardioides sp. TaxID=35761 RepID=UPI002E306D38|nr:PucR family transcriptional regulator [Nocardioides sp.]HEX3932806.1 PucR family transcriptional regulator [Nocardioides sp.]